MTTLQSILLAGCCGVLSACGLAEGSIGSGEPSSGLAQSALNSELTTLTLEGSTIPVLANPDFEVQLGLSMGEPVRAWIEASLSMNYQRKSGQLEAADFERKVRMVREFHDALLTEIGFPAADGAAKDPAYLSLKLAPEFVRNRVGAHLGVGTDAGVPELPGFIPSDFRFTLDGIATDTVASVSAVKVQLLPGGPRVTDLEVTFDQAESADWYHWHEDFVIDGQNEEAQEKTGALVFLDHSRSNELLTVTLRGLGLFDLTADTQSPGRMKARLHVKEVGFTCNRCSP